MANTNVDYATVSADSASSRVSEQEDDQFAPYKVHRYAKRYPLPDPKQFRDIVEDIRKHGLRKPIITTRDGEWIIDGRVRYLACREARIEPRFTKLSADQTDEMIWTYVWSSNLHRRHLTSDQRAVLAATYAEQIESEAKERQKFHGGTAPGRPRTLPPQQGGGVSDNPRARETTRVAARDLGVSKDKVQQVITLKKNATDLYKKVEAGAVPLSEAWHTYRSTRIDVPEFTLPKAAIGKRNDDAERSLNDQRREQQSADTLRNAAYELKHVFDVFTCTPGCLLGLSSSQRQLILAQAQAIAEIARQSLINTTTPPLD